jgi:tetratricopeptide (TPR) repeat protein
MNFKLSHKLYFSIILSFINFSLFCQNEKIDSLKSLLKNDINDVSRCEILINLIELESNDNVWIKYNDLLKEIAINNLNDTIKKSSNLQNTFLKFYSSALNNSAYIQYNQGNYGIALNEFTKCLNIQEKTRDEGGILRTKINIGNIYFRQGEIEKALSEFEKALFLSKSIKDNGGRALSLINLSNVYLKKNEIDKALTNYLDALMISKEMNDKIIQVSCYYSISKIYFIKKDFDKALEFNNKSLEISNEIDDKKGVSVASNNCADILYTKGDIKGALPIVLRGLEIATELGYPDEIMNSSLILTKIYKASNRPLDALNSYELFIKMKDSINNIETRKTIIKKEFQLDYEKKAIADSLKASEEKRITNFKLKQEKNQRYFLYCGLILTLVFGIFMFNRFRITQKQKLVIEKQKEIVDEKNHIIQEKSKEVEAKNKDIIDSIHYAKRIQTTLLPSDKYINKNMERLKKFT